MTSRELAEPERIRFLLDGPKAQATRTRPRRPLSNCSVPSRWPNVAKRAASNLMKHCPSRNFLIYQCNQDTQEFERKLRDQIFNFFIFGFRFEMGLV